MLDQAGLVAEALIDAANRRMVLNSSVTNIFKSTENADNTIAVNRCLPGAQNSRMLAMT